MGRTSEVHQGPHTSKGLEGKESPAGEDEYTPTDGLDCDYYVMYIFIYKCSVDLRVSFTCSLLRPTNLNKFLQFSGSYFSSFTL